MAIYLVLIFIIMVLGAGIHPRLSLRKRKVFLLVSFLLMTLLAGLRNISVGVDTASYVSMFRNIGIIDFNLSRYEPGFLYYLKGIHAVSDNPTVFLFANSILCVGLTCLFIKKHCDDPTFAVLLYVVLKAYFFHMTGIRQSLSTAFVLTAFSFLLDGKTKRNIIFSILMMVIAVSFHTLAIVAVIPFIIWISPKQLLVNRITPTRTLKWSIISSISAFIFYPYIMRAVGFVFPQYARYFSGTWADANYSASLFKLLIQVSFLVVGVMYIRKKEIIEEQDKLSMLMMMFSVIIGTLAMRMEIWGRLLGVFSIYTPLLWAPSFTNAEKDFHNRLILKSSVFIFSLAYMLVTFVFRPEWDGVVPYLFAK